MKEKLVENFRSNGKLLLTGEYLVLDGAIALAVPTRFGQKMAVTTSMNTDTVSRLEWESYDEKGNLWFKAAFSIPGFDIIASSGGAESVVETLRNLFLQIKQQSPGFLMQPVSVHIKTELEFARNWGLGSSSTLIANLALWSKTDPYQLLFSTFGGSGYDIACALHNQPILYRNRLNEIWTQPVEFQPPFSDQLYFVYSGKKQNSREAINYYRDNESDKYSLIKEFNNITIAVSKTQSLRNFEGLLDYHEALLSALLHFKTAKTLYFPDYWGSIKSLGAWGGDFVLATSSKSKNETYSYFKSKGYEIIIPYAEMVLGG